MPRDFDELNTQETVDWTYEQYFSVMELSDEEKEKRVKLAKEFEVLFLYFFLLYAENKYVDYAVMIYEKYVEIALGFLSMKSVPSYIDSYAKKLADEVVRVTIEHDGEEFYLSKDRGMLISANEANLVGNYGQYTQAIKSGKRQKTWVTEKDNKVRKTHRAVDEKKIGIFELFQVGNSLMMFPKDTSHNADLEEIAGCRCVAKYS